MIYLSDSVRRQHSPRLGAIILFKLNEDKGKTNLLPSCTTGWKRQIIHICYLPPSVHPRLCQQVFAANSTRFQ